MSKDVDQLYESLFTFEQMLTESIAQCAEVFELAERAGLSHVTQSLKEGIIPQLTTFLDGQSEHAMPAIVESIENRPSQQPRVREQRQEEPAYMNSGNPRYDEMFNKLLESSTEIEQTGRTKFKLDEIDNPSDDEIESTRHPLSEGVGRPPRQPGQKERVEFDGMENWRSLMNEATPSAPGGGAEDAIQSIMNYSESTPSNPPPGSPEIGNDASDVDPSVASILSQL